MLITSVLSVAIRFPDLINGSFEASGGGLIFYNCWRLYGDKDVKGIAWQVNIFYLGWGLWNMYYYPHLHQMLSFWGGIAMATGNLIWTTQAIWYLRKRGSL